MDRKIHVVFFQRRPLPIHKSVEFIFEDVRQRMPSCIESSKKVFSRFSKGIWSRILMIWEAYRSQGDVNHITGDIQFVAILLKKRKTIMTILDCGMLSATKGIRHMLLKLFWFKLPLKKCRFITVISTATKMEVLRYVKYPDTDIYVIPVAVSEAFQFSPSKHFNKECPTILQVGTTPNKNIGRLCEALLGVQCHLNIIGIISSDDKRALDTNKISYTAFANLTEGDLVKMYIESDIVSFISTYEGFGMPIVEAQAVGRPVVTSNISSMPEVAGDGACFVDPYDVQDIRRGVLNIIQDDQFRQEIVKKGLINCKRFNPNTIANQYLNLYQKIAEKN